MSAIFIFIIVDFLNLVNYNRNAQAECRQMSNHISFTAQSQPASFVFPVGNNNYRDTKIPVFYIRRFDLMAFDGITIACIAHELQEKLTGGRIAKIAQPEADELLLTVKTREGNHRLLLSASASFESISAADVFYPSHSLL